MRLYCINETPGEVRGLQECALICLKSGYHQFDNLFMYFYLKKESYFERSIGQIRAETWRTQLSVGANSWIIAV